MNEMNDAQVFSLAVWSLLMMGLGYGFEWVQNKTPKFELFEFFFNVVPALLAVAMFFVSVVSLIKLVAFNL